MEKEKELLREFKQLYSKNNLVQTYEICNELYKLKTGQTITEPIKEKMKNIIQIKINGRKPTFEEIKNCLYGIIELNIIQRQ